MRGVVSGAMLMGLRALGLTNAFDAVYGASAGAMGAAYFVSGQVGLRLAMWVGTGVTFSRWVGWLVGVLMEGSLTNEWASDAAHQRCLLYILAWQMYKTGLCFGYF